MIKTVVVESNYYDYGYREEFKFRVDDDATPDEIKQAGLKILLDNMNWYIKD